MNAQAHTDRMRTCVGCGQRMPAEALVRLVLAGDPPRLLPAMVLKDSRRGSAGRGVHVQPRRACLARAIQRGGFRRGLRAEVSTSLSELADTMRGYYVRRLEGLVVAARRAHKLAIGTDAVRDAVQAKQAQLLLVAEDAAGRREELEAAQRGLGGHCLVWGTKESWGRLVGRSEVGVLGILDAGIAREVLAAANHAAELAEEQ